MNENLRYQALILANSHGQEFESPGEVVERAKAYLDFLVSKETDE